MPKHPASIALLIQAMALTLTGVLAVAQTAFTLSLFEWSIVQGIMAGIVSHTTRMPFWWIPMHLAFVPLIIIALTLDISPAWYLAAFIGLLSIYGKSFKTQVPLYLSSIKAHQALESLLPKQEQFSFIDLGSGCGGLLTHLAQTCKNGSFCGVESAPMPFIIGKLRNLFNPNCVVRWGDFWKQDFSQYDVVYAYLSPVPMTLLWQKAKREMRPGSLLISNTFIIPGVPPHRSIKLNDFSHSTLHLWKI